MRKASKKHQTRDLKENHCRHCKANDWIEIAPFLYYRCKKCGLVKTYEPMD